MATIVDTGNCLQPVMCVTDLGNDLLAECVCWIVFDKLVPNNIIIPEPFVRIVNDTIKGGQIILFSGLPVKPEANKQIQFCL